MCRPSLLIRCLRSHPGCVVELTEEARVDCLPHDASRLPSFRARHALQLDLTDYLSGHERVYEGAQLSVSRCLYVLYSRIDERHEQAVAVQLHLEHAVRGISTTEI